MQMQIGLPKQITRYGTVHGSTEMELLSLF